MIDPASYYDVNVGGGLRLLEAMLAGGERMLDNFDLAYGLTSIRLRYFNAAGADPEGDLGEWHENETHLIPLAIEAAMGRSPAIKIFGTDYPTPDGTAVRDYLHATDLGTAHVATLNYLLEGGPTETVNLGTGFGASVNEVVRALESVSGRIVPKTIAARRAGDPSHLIADPSRATAVLSWRTLRITLCTIIEDAWHWHQRC